ncbi:MAG: hypothetical protein QXR62_04655 [Candidatus Bathyarchaeia archaeon]
MSIDWLNIAPEKKEKLLRVAEMLHRYKGTGVKQLSMFISKTLKVSGRDVGLAQRLMDAGVITITENGEAIWNDETEEKLREEMLANTVIDTSTAKTAVETTVQTHIAQRATVETEMLLKAGEAYRREMTTYLIEHGVKPEEWANRDPDQVIKEAFKALREVPNLRRENENLRKIVQLYEERLDPDIRLQKGIEMLTTALLLDRIYEAFGIDFINSKAGKTYLQLIDKFIGGDIIE